MWKKIVSTLVAITLFGGITLFAVNLNIYIGGGSSNTTQASGSGERTSDVTYPNVAGEHSGTVDNLTYNTQANIHLSLQQKQGDISGYLTVYEPLVGSGPLTGRIDSDGQLNFDVQCEGCNIQLSFVGSVHDDGTLGGTYTTSNDQNGEWYTT